MSAKTNHHNPCEILHNNKWAVLVNNDEQGFFAPPCVEIPEPDAMKAKLIEIVDRMAECGVTATSWCLISWFKSIGKLNVIEHHSGKPMWDCWERFYAAGYDPVKVVQQRCREKGILFLGGMRMNDRHHENQGCIKGKFINDNPQYRIKEPHYQGMGVDYKHDAVREKLLECLADLLSVYDLDGIEMDYMRWINMFEPGEGEEHTELLTDFMRKSRAIIDETASERGYGRMPLGVRMPPRVADCAYLGFDIKTWIDEGLIDYIAPSPFFCSDFSMPVEEYVELTKGSTCKVYPATFFTAGQSLRSWCSSSDRISVTMKEPQHKALFRNYAATGATGVQTYNIFSFENENTISTIPNDNRLLAITEANNTYKDPTPREYVHAPGFFHLQPGYTPNQTQFVHKLSADNPSGSLTLRACEDWSNSNLTGMLRFYIFPHIPEDIKLCVKLNGNEITDSLLRTRKQENEAPYEELLYALTNANNKALMNNGDNTISLELDIPDGDKQDYTFGEISLWVNG
jgi:hypothetical protein